MLSAFLRLPYFQYNFIFIDEAWWANGANILHQGGRLYVDIGLDKNPPIFWFCAFLFKIFGVSMNAVHAGALLLVCITSVLLFVLGTRFFSASVGAAAALIHAVASTTYYIPRIIGLNTETLMIVFSTAAALSYLTGVLEGRRFSFFIAGLFASCAFLTKPVAITETVLLALFVIFAGGGRFVSRLRSLAVLLAGFALGLGVFLTYLWCDGILSAWWEQAMLYGFRYVGRIGADIFFVKSLRAIVGFALIFAWLLILIWLSRRMRTENARVYTFAAYWLLSAFIGVAIGRRYYANYFIQVIPPLSLLGGIGLVQLWRTRHLVGSRLARRACLAAFLISFLWFHSRTLANWCALAFPQLHQLQLWDMWDADQRNMKVAEHLRRGTSADDAIFIWGSNAQLYFLAKRPMATIWMDYDVTDDYPPRAADPSIQFQTAEILSRNRPRYIIDVQQVARLENYPHFRSLVFRYYDLERQIAGVRMYRLRAVDP
jgi:4-amino-4-deoxy-L-arabinose transferase-like glycosyltransferase